MTRLRCPASLSGGVMNVVKERWSFWIAPGQGYTADYRRQTDIGLGQPAKP